MATARWERIEVDEWTKDGDGAIVRIAIAHRRGRQLGIDIREHYLNGGVWKPGKTGVRVPADMFEALRKGLDAADAISESPPKRRGSRSNGTNPRALGTNPKAIRPKRPKSPYPHVYVSGDQWGACVDGVELGVFGDTLQAAEAVKSYWRLLEDTKEAEP
jgi:hypothetical protein